MGREKHLHPLAASENIIFAPKDHIHRRHTGFRRARDIYVYFMTFLFICPHIMTLFVYTAHTAMEKVHVDLRNGRSTINVTSGQ